MVDSGKHQRIRGARERVLDAAERRLLAHGPAGLVLDAVAAEAEVSKGGLLYHFRSKQALVAGLTDRMLAEFEQAQSDLADDEPDGRGRWARAYLASTVTADGEPKGQSGQLMASLLAGLGGNTSGLTDLQDHFAQWHRRIQDDAVDPVQAAIVRLAADGLWLSSLLGLKRVDPTLDRQVVGALEGMTRT
ncbi:MAG: TetR/AcrR family transcriptional regulator [Candidatus Binatia bacterium]|nr:TetR/AcrR family transcriptional regulator [Candidatus Binatia bacterium]